MSLAAVQQPNLLRNRSQVVAKSFYRQLKTEGFSHEQIIELSTKLLDLVTEDLQEPALALTAPRVAPQVHDLR